MNEHIAKTIKAVFFDHDDTLVGTIGTKWAQHKHIARTFYGKELADEELKLHWGKPLGEMIGLLYGTTDTEEAMARNVATHTDFEKYLFQATIPVLKQLKNKGLRLGIITATTRYSFEHDLTHHKVPKALLDYTQTAEDTDFHKPDFRVFEPALIWLKRHEIKPIEVLYIGDGLHDMKAAVEAGFNFLGVQTGLVTADEFVSSGASSIKGIEQLLEK